VVSGELDVGILQPPGNADSNPLVAIILTAYTGSAVNIDCLGKGSSMKPNFEQGRRAVPSAVLEKLREERVEALKDLDPGQRMEIAFSLSLEARKLSVAGMKAQGFSEAEIAAALKASRKWPV
jgi:DNA-binding NarL/FixJ family response regulator